MSILHPATGNHFYLIDSDVDFGFHKLIVNGSVKVVHGNVEKLTATSIDFDDGSRVAADAIVLASERIHYSLYVTDILTENLALGGFPFVKSIEKYLEAKSLIERPNFGV